MPTMGTTSAAAGVISTVLLTLVVVLGIGVNRRVRLPGQPRAAGIRLHRLVSLLALGFLTLHILTAVEAPYARLGLAAAVVPFISSYAPLWIGLGAAAFDLVIVLIASSLLRRHVGRRTWRALHWLAYACWPAAIAHSLGAGSGMRAGRLLDLAIACMAVVVGAAGWRLAAAIGAARKPRPHSRPARAIPLPAAARRPDPSSLRAREPGSLRLSVDPIACTGHGVCADLLPELIALDQWGFPLLAEGPVPASLAGRARRAVTDCPVLALRLASAGAGAPAGNGIAPRQAAQ